MKRRNIFIHTFFIATFLGIMASAYADEIIWVKAYSMGEGFEEEGNSVKQTTDGGYIICGYANDDVLLIKTDANGDTVWSKLYGYEGDESAHCVQQTDDLGYIVCGSTVSLDYWDFDVWVLKTDAMGRTVIPSNPSALEAEPDQLVEKFELYQNYPNPFNPNTVISWQVGATGTSPAQVELSIYNVLGHKVATLVSERQSVGYHTVTWDGSGYASGLYYYRLEANGPTENFQQVRKMVL